MFRTRVLHYPLECKQNTPYVYLQPSSPEGGPCGSKHVEDIVKIKISLTNVHFIGWYYTITLQRTLQRI